MRITPMYLPQAGWGPFALRVALANLALGLLLYAAAGAFDWIGMQGRWGLRAGAMAGVIATAALVYLAVLALTGLRLRDLVRRA